MTTFIATDDGHADLSNHDAFLGGAPHNTFARLRREDPLAWTEMKGSKGFWSVTRYSDILELNRNVALLSSVHGIRMEDQTEEEYRDCSESTGFSQSVQGEVMQGFVDGLRRGLHATYPAQDGHGSARASALDRHSFASCDSADCPAPPRSRWRAAACHRET